MLTPVTPVDVLARYDTSSYPYGKGIFFPTEDSIVLEKRVGVVNRYFTIEPCPGDLFGIVATDDHGPFLSASGGNFNAYDALAIPDNARAHWRMPVEFFHEQYGMVYLGPNIQSACAHIVGIYDMPGIYFPCVKFVSPIQRTSGYTDVLSVGIRASLHHDTSGFYAFMVAFHWYFQVNPEASMQEAIFYATKYAYSVSPWNVQKPKPKPQHSVS